MIQPPWDKIIEQLRVYHLSVTGIDGPEHRYDELEKEKKSFILSSLTFYNMQSVDYLLFKEPNRN